MGKGGFGKGFGGFGKGWGKGPCFGKGWGKGPSPVAVAATTVAAAAVTGAVVASVVARPARPRFAPKGKGKGAVVIVADRECLLNDVHVRLPADGIETKMGRRYYQIDVTAGSGSTPWRVSRCYSDFENLRDRLGPEVRHSGIRFPPHKHSFGFSRLSSEMAQERRQGLQAWLQSLLEHPLSRGPWSRALLDFLEVDFHAHQPAPTRTADRRSDSDLLLEVEIPKGVEAGQALAVEVPGGQQVSVVVPRGRHPGDILQLQFDDFEQTLRPVL